MNSALKQRHDALALAQAARTRQADLRRSIGNLSPLESRRAATAALMAPDPGWSGLSVYRLLTACRLVGPRKATLILARVPVVQNRPLHLLTDRQRQRIAQLLEETT